LKKKKKMEKESLMSLLVKDQESSSKSPEETQATFTGMFPVNLHSILAANTTQPLLPLSLFADNYCSLTAPKTEPPLYHHHQPPQYGAVSAQTSSLNDYYSIFNHLPDLLSLDHSPYKRPRLLDHQTRASSSYQLYPTPPESQPAPVVVPRGSSLARKRRQTLSDKMRCLQKLLPWEKKMDNATMLEAAHRYVRFLQAQVAALQAMPIVASDSASSLPVLTRGVGGGTGEVEMLSRLSRSQMLQVAVNSPVAQTRMSDLGRCVFSVEQLALLNKKSVIRSAMVSASGHYYPTTTSFIDSSASASTTNLEA
ncbi:transcription factor bHLH117, partial [Rosa rugosa]|uniref:transcription factor bHLH117 n=1 Tax=Rosa rugosa TaxID=74645 RepID=UPI002B40DB72